MTATPNEPWYQKGLRFQCAQCGDCCTGAPGYVWVDKAEIAALAAALQLDVGPFESRYVRRVGRRKSLIELAGGDCVFFDNQNRVCKVYDNRPRQCRTWPFWASNLATAAAWEQVCAYCAGGNRGPVVPFKKIQRLLGVVNI
ncbi:MAG: YkgJ family cysteine cluster protein [Thermoguttaceae bacterium]|jgi:Fe-S-cluster containining protein